MVCSFILKNLDLSVIYKFKLAPSIVASGSERLTDASVIGLLEAVAGRPECHLYM